MAMPRAVAKTCLLLLLAAGLVDICSSSDAAALSDRGDAHDEHLQQPAVATSRRHGATTPLEAEGRVHVEGEGLMQRGFGLKPRQPAARLVMPLSQSLASMVLFVFLIVVGMHGVYGHEAELSMEEAEDIDFDETKAWGSTLGLQRFFQLQRGANVPAGAEPVEAHATLAAKEQLTSTPLDDMPDKSVRIQKEAASLLGLQRRTNVVRRAAGSTASASEASKDLLTSGMDKADAEAAASGKVVGSVHGLQRGTVLRRGVVALTDEEDDNDSTFIERSVSDEAVAPEPVTGKASLLGLQRATSVETVVLPSVDEE